MTKTIRTEDDLLVTRAMGLRLRAEGEFEGGSGDWWAVLHRANRELVRAKSSPFMPAPREPQQMFALDMSVALNEHLHHDGKWVVAFTHPTAHAAVDAALGMATTDWERFLFMWVDADGDPQFTVDNDGVFDEALLAGPDHWMEQAEAAWQRWNLHMRDVIGSTEGVTFKRAQGERRPSAGRTLIVPPGF